MAASEKNREEIFCRAIEIADAAERAAFLDQACGEDHELREKVEALLKAHERAGDFLAPPAGACMTLDPRDQIDGPGTIIGRYQLLELVGEGGMGLVYLAEQKEPVRRKVALKIIKPGMDSRQVIARFESERQTLAVLDHPTIAHVFDAGCTETGRPYFVMEFVKGLPITSYCDQNRLTIEQRLRLFEQVCEAVHHAHQKGIIHRDLKPSNILVSIHSDRPVPKIIDFGIAKAITSPLTDKTFVTLQGQLLGTPEYMSPEQVDLAAQDIDTRSDIYSLGVVLYELLAGVLPFESESFAKAGLAEIQQTIREQEPASPSIRLTNLGEKAHTIAASRGTQVVPLARRLHRELEWIPLKAMRKDRCRRYKSASEMADDLRNYLNGNPLLAGPETTIYRVQKFVHKHAGSVTTVVLVAAAIILGLVVSTAMYFKAEDARQKETLARTHAERAEDTTKAKAEELRHTLYVNSIQLADAKYREGNIGHVRALLDACPEDLRGWEWRRLAYVSDQPCMTLRGHDDIVYSVALDPEGKRIISGSQDGTVKVWDADTGAELKSLQHGSTVWSVAFNQLTGRLVSGGDEVKVWDMNTGAELITIPGPKRGIVSCVAFSPDGRFVFSGGGDTTFTAREVTTGAQAMTFKGHTDGVCSMAVSPDGTRIVSGGADNMIRVWNTTTGDELMMLEGHRHMIISLAFSPDGKRIVSGSMDNTMRLWDASTGAELMIARGHGRPVDSVAFSPDGSRVASGSRDTMIKIWDVATGDELMTLRGHGYGVGSVAFSPDGKRIISGGWDNTVKVWDVTFQRESTRLLEHGAAVYSVAFSPDGKRLASCERKTVRIWDMTSRSELMTLRGHRGAVISVCFSPDGKRIASAGADKTIRIWDAAIGTEELILHGSNRWLSSIAFSPDGRHIATAGDDNTIKVWDVQSAKETMTLRGHGRAVISAAFSPDGKRIVSGSMDTTIKIWDASTGAELMTIRGHQYPMYAVGFSPDGTCIAASSYEDLRLWDAASGAELMTLSGHKGPPAPFLSFSPDGKRIVSGSLEGTVRVWDIRTGAELISLEAGSAVASATFSPDGKVIAAGTFFGNGIIVWDSVASTGGYEAQKSGKDAKKLVDELHEKHGFYRDVINQLQSDPTLDSDIRKLALQIASSRKEEDSENLRSEAWKTVGSPERSIDEYRAALGKAQNANDWEPNDPAILDTLGAAQYRTGAYEEALKTLATAEKLLADEGDKADPPALAFKALALHQLGRAGEAKATLEQLRGLLKDEQFAYDPEAKALLAEAEGVIEGGKK